MKTRKILIGDDNKAGTASLGRALRGSQVDFAYTPSEVVEKARTETYDVIVTDLDYTEPAGAEGFLVLSDVRELAPVRILYSGRADDAEVQRRAREAGATHVVEKSDLSGLLKLVKGGEE